jgi:hypothetical protein
MYRQIIASEIERDKTSRESRLERKDSSIKLSGEENLSSVLQSFVVCVKGTVGNKATEIKVFFK